MKHINMTHNIGTEQDYESGDAVDHPYVNTVKRSHDWQNK